MPSQSRTASKTGRNSAKSEEGFVFFAPSAPFWCDSCSMKRTFLSFLALLGMLGVAQAQSALRWEKKVSFFVSKWRREKSSGK